MLRRAHQWGVRWHHPAGHPGRLDHGPDHHDVGDSGRHFVRFERVHLDSSHWSGSTMVALVECRLFGVLVECRLFGG